MTNYVKAPIEEIVIDIRVEGLDEKCIASLERLKEEIADLDSAQPITEIEMQFGGGPIDLTNLVKRDGQVGWCFSANSPSRVIQAKTSNFTFSYLKPYSNWSSFSTDARTTWGFYLKYVTPTAISRIGVRVINRISIPIRPVELDDYFLCAPHGPSSAGPIAGFFTQVQFLVDQIESGSRAVLNFASDDRSGTIGSNLLLDIDQFVEKSIAVDDEKIWKIIDAFGVEKNKIFESCITDRTRELFK